MAGLSEVFNLDLSKTLADFDKINAKLIEAKENYAKAKQSAFSTTETLNAQSVEVAALQKEYNTLKTAVVNATVAEQNLEKASIDNVKAGKAELNSVADNRKAYNALYAEYVRLPRATEAQREQADALGKTLGGLSNTLKEQEKIAGDTRRNVGNYFKEIQIGGISINGLSSGLKAAKEAFTSGETGAKAFGLALKATGIGLFVAAVSALIVVFKDFAPVADFVENIIGTISTTVSKLILHLQNLDFSAAFGDITGITDTYKAVSDLNEATRQLEDSEGAYINSQAKLRGEVEKNLLASRNVNASYAERIEAVNKANKAEQKAFDEQRKRQQQQVDAAKKALINITGNYDELDAELEAYTNGQAEFYDGIEQGNEAVKEALKKYAEEKAKLTDIDTAQGNLEEKLAQRREQITEKEQARVAQVRAKREADNAKAKAELERLQKAYEDYYLNLEKLQSKYLDTEEQQLYDSFQADLDAIKGQSEQEIALRISIENKRAKSIADLRLKLLNDQFKKEYDATVSNLNLTEQEKNVSAENDIERMRNHLSTVEAILEAEEKLAMADGERSQDEINRIRAIRVEIANLQKDISKAEKAIGGKTIAEAFGVTADSVQTTSEVLGAIGQQVASVIGAVNNLYQTQIDNLENKRQAEIADVENSVATQQEKDAKISEINKASAQEQYDIQKKQFEANQALQITQASIQYAMGVISLFTAPWVAAIPFGIGYAIAGVLAGAMTAVYALNLKAITSATPPAPPKFQRGGLLVGNSHKQGGIPIRMANGGMIEAEGGEVIINRKSSARFRSQLSAINSYGGYGDKFAMGGIIGDGGYVSRSISRDAENRATAQIITDALRAMPQPKVSVVEINEVDARRQAAIKVGS